MKKHLALLLAGCAVSAQAQVINEICINHVGSDTREYVEIYGAPSTDYSSLRIIQIEGDGTPSGTIDSIQAVGTTDANGFWVAPYSSDRYENGTMTLLLVSDFTGAQGQDLDTNNDGAFDATPWTSILDGIGINDNGAGDLNYGGVPVLFPSFDGGSLTVGGASRIPNGQDTDSTADWTRNDFDLYGVPGFVGTPALGEAVNTPGAVNRLVVAGTISVAPADDFASSGPVGGPFAPATIDYTVTNTGDIALDWSAFSDAAWTDVAPGGGNLSAGQSQGFTVSVNATANTLAAGVYAGTLSVTNLTNGNGNTTRGLELTVTGGACDPCDTNCDGSVNGQDIGGFIDALAGNPNGCSPCNSDADGNGSINGQDIDDFVACLGG